MASLEKAGGFPGERTAMLPRPVAARAREHTLMKGVLPTEAGYFPRAEGHLVNRPDGTEEAAFIYCAKGSGWCEIAGLRHEVHAGDLLVVSPHTPHVYGSDEDDPWTIHWVCVQGGLVPAFLRELRVNAQRPVVHIGEDSRSLTLFEEVLAALEQDHAMWRLLYASQTLSLLLAGLIRDDHQRHREEPGPSQRVAQTIAFMEQRLKEPLQLETLAKIANLSRSQYAALFKEQTGYAPIDYFIRLRMHRARQLLDTTDMSIHLVAAEVGYEDPLYFSRVFRSVNKKSPVQYRQTRKG